MYPIKRNRRLRANQYIRNLVKENNISANDLIYPLFIIDGKGIKEEIPSMRDYYTISLDILKKEVKLLWKIGIQAVLIFPKIKESLKDNKGLETETSMVKLKSNGELIFPSKLNIKNY